MKRTLTPRETEIVELVAFGLSQKEIGDKLEISPNTVDVTVKNIKTKLDLQKSTELAAWYFINTYHITLNLSPIKRAMISLSFLALMVVSLFEGFNPERSFRTMRASRAQVSRTLRSGRRSNEFDYYLLTA
jgi:DNA-binding CsgD family transcriptional regulator